MHRASSRPVRALAARTAAAAAALLLPAPALAAPGVTSAVSVSSAGVVGDSGSNYADMTPDGRFVSFASMASNLVPGDTNGVGDVFVRDRRSGATERVSVGLKGVQGDGDSNILGISTNTAISDDGRYVAFKSEATNLVRGDRNGATDVFVHDRATGTTERVSLDNAGREIPGGGDEPSISPDGRYVAFTNFVGVFVRDRLLGTTERVSDNNGSPAVSADGRYVAFSSGDVFVRDRLLQTTEQANVSSSGAQTDGPCWLSGISADGRYIAFTSFPSNSLPLLGAPGVFVRDRMLRKTERVSVDSDGVGFEWATTSLVSLADGISADGRYVAFSGSGAHSPGGVFVRDRVEGATQRVSVSSEGAQASGSDAAISADGRFVAFTSDESNLVADDTNFLADGFVRDRLLGKTERVTVTNDGTQALGRQAIGSGSRVSAISADGRYVTFTSDAANLVAADATGHRPWQLFVRDRSAQATTLVSVGRDWTPHAGRLLLRPWPARAGHRLSATMTVTAGGTPLTTGRFACAATLAGRKLAADAHSFERGSVRCAWKIPKTARRKLLSGSLTVATADGTAIRRFARPVR